MAIPGERSLAKSEVLRLGVPDTLGEEGCAGHWVRGEGRVQSTWGAHHNSGSAAPSSHSLPVRPQVLLEMKILGLLQLQNHRL